MARIMTGLRVPAEAVARLLKARAGLVQKRVWIKDSQGRKGHSRMAWVRPENERPMVGRGQADLFAQPEPPAAKMFLRVQGSEHKEPVASLKEASEKYVMVRAKAESQGEGGYSKTPRVEVVDGGGKVIGIVSYNGRVWAPETYGQAGARPIYDTDTDEERAAARAEVDRYAEDVRRRAEEIPANPSEYTPRWPEKGEFSGNGLGDNGREYEGYRNGNDVRFYDTESGREIGENGEFLDEAGAKKPEAPGDYKIYHDSFTSVVNEVIRHIDDQGLYLAENDVFNSIASGPGKPKNGRTDRYDLPLYDADGKPAKKAVHFQVYDMGNGKYELNLYTSSMKAKDYAEDKVQVRKEAGITGDTKKPFEEMTFEAKKATGKPENVGETVRDILGVSNGSAAQFAGSSKVADIGAFQYAAAKWAYENDKIGTGLDILGQYAKAKSMEKEAVVASAGDPYPNRKLNMQRARTHADDEYSPEAMAEIALSNLKVGERFLAGNTWLKVASISDKSLIVETESGERKTYRPSTDKWQSFVRDVGGSILGAHHGVDAGDLFTALRRDPAAHWDGSMFSIRDADGMRKSAMQRFRDGLAKAFGAR